MTDEQDLAGELMNVPDGGDLSLSELWEAVRHRTRVRRIARGSAASITVASIALLTLTLGLGTRGQQVQTGGLEGLATSSTPMPMPKGTGHPTDPGDENYVDPAKVPLYPGWLAEYDPAEVAEFRALHPDWSIVGVVTTLEFRRACRLSYTALTALSQTDVGERPAFAATLMDPLIARVTEREPSSKSSADDGFARVRDLVITGDLPGANAFFGRLCGSVPEINQSSSGSDPVSDPRAPKSPVTSLAPTTRTPTVVTTTPNG